MIGRQGPAALCGLAMCIFTASAGAQEVTKKWESAYSEPGVSFQTLNSSAIDAYGNIYLTGEVTLNGKYEARTVKFDASGNQVWVAGHGKDVTGRVAVDRKGNVFTIGFADGAGPTIIKLDSDGKEVWQRTVSRSGYAWGIKAITADALGNVYLGVDSYGVSGTQDFTVIKYDTNGVIAWEREYNGSGNGADVLRAMTVDSAGNIIVVGKGAEADGANYTTVKYSPNGQQLWVARYTNRVRTNVATKVITDDAGNVYVTGESTGSGSGSAGLDVATLKYDSNGRQIWVSRYNGQLNLADRALSLALDVNNDVIVGAGVDMASYNWGGHHAAIKYDGNSGNQLWVAAYPYSEPNAVAVTTDGSGNVYMAARTPAISVVKYNSAGRQLWEQRALNESGSLLTTNLVSVDVRGCVTVVDGDFVAAKFCQGVQTCN